MKVFSVICEYNPFHNGHKYMIDKAKEKGASHIVAIMGGNFLQRGDVALINKQKRAFCAVKNGADLVVELPTIYATASAEKFAQGGIGIANGLGCTDNIIFGSENGNVEDFKKLARLTLSDEFNNAVKKKLSLGISYPKALSECAKDLECCKLSQLLLSPNNTLGIEYIKALYNTNSSITPLTVERKGAMHNSDDITDNIASASNIRERILRNKDWGTLVPESICNIIKDEINCGRIACLQNGERAILYKLRNMSLEDFANLPDVSEGLENRIYEAVQSGNNIEDITNSIKTKRYTLARIRRIIMYAILGITKDMQNTKDNYIRVLAFNDKGTEILKKAKKTAALPVINKISDSIKSLNNTQRRMLELDIFAGDIYPLFCEKVYDCKTDYTSKSVKI